MISESVGISWDPSPWHVPSRWKFSAAKSVSRKRRPQFSLPSRSAGPSGSQSSRAATSLTIWWLRWFFVPTLLTVFRASSWMMLGVACYLLMIFQALILDSPIIIISYSVWGEQQNCVPIIVVPIEVHVLHQMKGQQPLKPVRQNPIISDKFCKSNMPPLATGWSFLFGPPTDAQRKITTRKDPQNDTFLEEEIYYIYINCNRQLEFKPVQLKASYFSRGSCIGYAKKNFRMVSGFRAVKAPVV